MFLASLGALHHLQIAVPKKHAFQKPAHPGEKMTQFVSDRNGRVVVGASCPDIGELGLANLYDDGDEVAQSYDPLRRCKPLVDEVDEDCLALEEINLDEAQAPWWYDFCDEREAIEPDEDDAPTEATLPADADNDDDLDELDAMAEHVAKGFDMEILEERALRAHLQDRDPGRQPANKGGSWIHRRPRQWVVARGHDSILQATPRRTPKAFCEAERLADILAEATA
ncbi:TPA: hypothetical protein DDY56_03735 [Candidatus Uhrbacteria bacterium]|nr:hypothetical protein [Candidatus Uhrbacteria bacterium]HAN06704.1 hypothetical protein [Candidatus Uhrbacteria bacterium]HBA51669.1 hypothetical protein [Candidatus Uhrbacteria bacterium]HBC39785.1 hypothetical protein [Candidatus Uhrbacteria bacterium]HBJ62697.1 hypothetical protein [Candidatus Uhrbacteria bacterium]